MALTRIEALAIAFGITNATIERITELTGCEANELTYAEPRTKQLGSPYSWGVSAGRAFKNLKFNTQCGFPKERGHLDYWLGVARGVQIEKGENS